MMRYFYLIVFFLGAFRTHSNAQSIALVGLNSNNGSDKFSFVALEDIPNGDVYYFTDDAYDPITNTFDAASVESMYQFISPGIVTGDVIVVSETTTNILTETCDITISCGSSVTLFDSPFSLGGNDELFCFTTTQPLGATPTVVITNIQEIHSSIRGTGAVFQNPSPNYPNAVNVLLPGSDGQFNVATRSTMLVTADLENAANYVVGDASSTVRFAQLNGGTISGAEIQVTGFDGGLINNGSSTSSCSNNTLLPPIPITGSTQTHAFQIENVGTDPLNLVGAPSVTISGSGALTVFSQPGTPVSGGGTTFFEIVFTPTSVEMHTATISIANDDTDENPFTFIIEGEGVAQPLTPAIAIIGMTSTTPDQFSFVALRDVLPGEVFYFTDDTYDEETNSFEFGNGTESLFKYEPAATVFAGDVVVVTEGSTTNQILVTCTDQCSDTDITFIDTPFSISAVDALYCFTSSATTGIDTDIFANVGQIHSSLAISSNTDYSDHNCFHPTALHVQMLTENGQFNIPLRETTGLTDYTALEDSGNYVDGPASSTVPFDRITIGCGDILADNGGIGLGFPYNANSSDATIVCPDYPGDIVYIEFTFVDIEASEDAGTNSTGCWDYLSIYDGNSTDSTLIGNYCGEGDGDGNTPSIPANLLETGDNFYATNTTGCLTFVFLSDNIVHEEGFEALITCGPPPTCPTPTNLTSSNIQFDAFNVGWTGHGANNFIIEYGISDFALGDGTTIVSTVNSTTISTLTSGETYDVYIREICSPGDTSFWAGPLTETVNCNPVIPGNTFATPIVLTGHIYDEVYSNEFCYTNDNVGSAGNDVIFSYTTNSVCADSIFISTCSDTTNFDTFIYLIDSLGTVVGSNDDAATGTCDELLNGINRFSILRSEIVPGMKYSIVVDGYSATSQGTFGLTMYTYITGGELNNPRLVPSLPYSDIDNTACFSNGFAGSGGNDVYYKFTTGPCTDTILVSTCADTTNFDTFIYLLDEDGNELFNNDDSPFGTCNLTLNGLNRFSVLRGVVAPNTTYFVVVDGYDEFSKGTYRVTIEEICRPGVAVAPKIFLEGSYNSSAGLMNDDLRVQGVLSFGEPFTSLGYTHVAPGGGEIVAASLFDTTGNDAIVDWLLIELRDATDPTTVVATTSALLQRDGDVVDYRNGNSSPIEFTGIANGDYYVSVKSRNHLGVMSDIVLTLTQTNNTIIDFTVGNTFGTDAQKLDVVNSLFFFYEGDLDGNGTIDASDRSIAWNFRNQSGYLQQDSNLNGVCDAAERSQTWNNRNKTSQIPSP